MKNKRVSGYRRNVLAFFCGYILVGAVLNACGIWGFAWWHRNLSPTPQFEFIEGLVFVLFFGILAGTSYCLGAIVRSVGLTSPDFPSSGRAALFGAGSVAALWLIAFRGPTNRGITFAFVAVIPGVLGYLAGRRKPQTPG